jgi:dipeptidyl aminopeptidase/acylaminoacyl peptidase
VIARIGQEERDPQHLRFDSVSPTRISGNFERRSNNKGQHIMPQSPDAFRPWTPEEIVDLVSPADPVISPDGTKIAFTVMAGGRKGEHPERTIWLSRDGQPAVPFTTGLFNDSAPVWSPDGSRLLFISDRKVRGTQRLYLISPDGGEAQPLGDLEGHLSNACFSPDGRSVAVIRSDPETEDERSARNPGMIPSSSRNNRTLIASGSSTSHPEKRVA